MIAPTAGPTTTSGLPNSRSIFAASALQSRSVRSGYWKTRFFCRNIGLCSPEARMKWPWRSAPAPRNSSSTSSVVMRAEIMPFRPHRKSGSRRRRLLGRRGRATLAGPEEYPMRPNPRLAASLLAFAALGLAAPASAQPPAPAAQADPVALSADIRTLNDAVQALNTQGYGALAKHAPALRAIYDRTPPAARPGSPEAQVYGGSALLLAMLANEL